MFCFFCLGPTATCSQSQPAAPTSSIREVDKTAHYPSKLMCEAVFSFSMTCVVVGVVCILTAEYRKPVDTYSAFLVMENRMEKLGYGL